MKVHVTHIPLHGRSVGRKCQTVRPVLTTVPGCTHRLTDKQAIAYSQDVADCRRNWRARSDRSTERIVHILDAAHKCWRPPERDWWVFSTGIREVVLMLQCHLTGAFGIVRRPSKKELNAAFMAPSHPYRWNQPNRVELVREAS